MKIMLNKARQLNNGTYPLVAQLLRFRKKRLIYSSLHLYEDELDTLKLKVLPIKKYARSMKELRKMNTELSAFQKQIDNIIFHLDANLNDYQVDDIVDCYNRKKRDENLDVHFDYHIERLIKQNRIGMAQAFRNTLRSLIRFRGNNIKFSAINSRFVTSYELYLQSIGLSPNTVCYYIRNLKSLYHLVIKEGERGPSSENPFIGVRSSPHKTVKRALDRDVLRKLSQMSLEDESHLALARDLFMFSFYTRGMAFVDMAFLRKNDICGRMIYYKRRKTGQQLQIGIIEPIERIIACYQSASEYIFPLINSVDPKKAYNEYRRALRTINRDLKILTQRIGHPFPLTTYMARHSWATQAKEHGAPLSVISEGLGHTSEKITQIYLKQFDNSVLDSINEIVSKL